MLKRDAQGRGEFWLAHSQFDAPLSDAHCNVNIYWFGRTTAASGRSCFVPHSPLGRFGS